MSVPQVMQLLWSHWQLDWPLEAQAALVAGLYVWATRRVTGGWPLRRTLSFLGGAVCVLVALQSGVDSFDDQLLTAHMVQHLMLLEVAPLLLMAGRPSLLVLRAARVSQRPRLAGGLARLRPATTPVGCLTVFSLIVVLSHLPAFYDATLRDPALHDFEHVAYVAGGLLLWWPILDGDPSPRGRLDGFGRLVYMIAAMVPMALIGAYLNRHTSLVYSGYGPPARALGVSALTAQQQAGALMWVVGGSVMVVVGLWQATATMLAEERRLTARERRLDATVRLNGEIGERPVR
jgi:putative membrane protein